MANIGVEHWCINKSNNYPGVGKDSARFDETVERRRAYSSKFIEGLLGDGAAELPSDYFDVVFSISVIQQIDS